MHCQDDGRFKEFTESCDGRGFASAIDSSLKDGGYVLNITNTAAILVCNEVTGKIEVDLN